MAGKKKSPMKKIDKLVTGIIIWWAVASIFKIGNSKKGKKASKKVLDNGVKTAKKGYRFFWKWLLKLLSFFDKKKNNHE